MADYVVYCRPTFADGLHSTSLVASRGIDVHSNGRKLESPARQTPVGRLLPRSLEVLLEV